MRENLIFFGDHAMKKYMPQIFPKFTSVKLISQNESYEKIYESEKLAKHAYLIAESESLHEFIQKLGEEDTNNKNIPLDLYNFYAAYNINFPNMTSTVMIMNKRRIVALHLSDLFEQARRRQRQNPGTQYLGTVLQHLVAAKLCLILPEGSFEIHGASVADGPTEREGDFVINRSVIHCTTMPGAALIEKCKTNLRGGFRPVIITILDRVLTAFHLAEDAGLAGRVEVWDIQQFLSANVHEHSLFDDAKRDAALAEIICNYNKIVLEVECDPSLRIAFESR